VLTTLSFASRGSRCFCCFCRKLSAIDILFAAESLGFQRYRGEKNSGNSAVTRCKPAGKSQCRGCAFVCDEFTIILSELDSNLME